LYRQIKTMQITTECVFFIIMIIELKLYFRCNTYQFFESN